MKLGWIRWMLAASLLASVACFCALTTGCSAEQRGVYCFGFSAGGCSVDYSDCKDGHEYSIDCCGDVPCFCTCTVDGASYESGLAFAGCGSLVFDYYETLTEQVNGICGWKLDEEMNFD